MNANAEVSYEMNFGPYPWPDEKHKGVKVWTLWKITVPALGTNQRQEPVAVFQSGFEARMFMNFISDRKFHDEQDHLNRGVEPSADEWTRAVPLNPEQLKEFRAHLVALGDELGHSSDVYTCDGCARAPICLLAFDGYNTDGDCLYSK